MSYFADETLDHHAVSTLHQIIADSKANIEQLKKRIELDFWNAGQFNFWNAGYISNCHDNIAWYEQQIKYCYIELAKDNLVELANQRYGNVVGNHFRGNRHFMLFFKYKKDLNKFVKETGFLLNDYQIQTCYHLKEDKNGEIVNTSKVENYKIWGNLRSL